MKRLSIVSMWIFNSLHYNNDDIIKKIEILLETLYLLDTNVNIPLLMDSMMYRITGRD